MFFYVDETTNKAITIRTNEKVVGKTYSRSFSANKPIETETEASQLKKIETLGEILMQETDPICMLCKALRLPENSAAAVDSALADRCRRYRPLEQLKNFLLLDDNTSVRLLKIMAAVKILKLINRRI